MNFLGFELKALRDDGGFGLKRSHQFSRITVVTEQNWFRAGVAVLCSFFHGELPVFRLSELQAAKTWIMVTGNAGP
ncbi:MAG: STAS/SEC14 domain-containing protein [Rhodanobacteraceae bacterium]